MIEAHLRQIKSANLCSTNLILTLKSNSQHYQKYSNNSGHGPLHFLITEMDILVNVIVFHRLKNPSITITSICTEARTEVKNKAATFPFVLGKTFSFSLSVCISCLCWLLCLCYYQHQREKKKRQAWLTEKPLRHTQGLPQNDSALCGKATD